MIDRNHNLESKNQFENLLKSLVPRFPEKASQTSVINIPSTLRVENITTVDVSSDETDTSAIGAVGGKSYSEEFFENLYRNNFGSHRAVVISDDEDEPRFHRESLLSSTRIRKVDNDLSSPVSSHRKSESSSTVPPVTPVNSLREKHQHLNCLKDDAIISIVKKFGERRLQDDQHIRENEQA